VYYILDVKHGPKAPAPVNLPLGTPCGVLTPIALWAIFRLCGRSGESLARFRPSCEAFEVNGSLGPKNTKALRIRPPAVANLPLSKRFLDLVNDSDWAERLLRRISDEKPEKMNVARSVWRAFLSLEGVAAITE
jgi:hypothetical protein